MNNQVREIQHHHNSLNEIGFLRLDQILKLIPIGKTTWWNGIKSGRFPKPVKIGSRVTAWKAEDIRDLIKGYK